ncbi:MAG: PDZ domain-containing protein [bacterium]|nr:PDZ domain-containing protein [bacterium]
MRQIRFVMIAVMMCAIAISAFAGGEKCKGEAKDCVKKLEAKIAAKGWLGVETAKVEHGYFKVERVHAGSPAEAAGFQPGDVLLAINGAKFGDKEGKAALKKAKMGPGSEVEYIVKRADNKAKLVATLGHVPEKVAKIWIAEHIEHEHKGIKMASK